MGNKLLWVGLVGVAILALTRMAKADTPPPQQRASLWDSGMGGPLEDGDELAGDQYLDTNTGDVYEFA